MQKRIVSSLLWFLVPVTAGLVDFFVDAQRIVAKAGLRTVVLLIALAAEWRARNLPDGELSKEAIRPLRNEIAIWILRTGVVRAFAGTMERRRQRRLWDLLEDPLRSNE